MRNSIVNSNVIVKSFASLFSKSSVDKTRTVTKTRKGGLISKPGFSYYAKIFSVLGPSLAKQLKYLTVLVK